MKPSRVEQIKLFSNYLNGMAVSVFAIGGFGFLFQMADSEGLFEAKTLLKYGSAVFFSLLIHLLAQWKLRRLDHDLDHSR